MAGITIGTRSSAFEAFVASYTPSLLQYQDEIERLDLVDIENSQVQSFTSTALVVRSPMPGYPDVVVSAFGSGFAVDDFGNLYGTPTLMTIQQGNVTLFSINISASRITMTSGDASLILNGNFPTTFDQLDALLSGDADGLRMTSFSYVQTGRPTMTGTLSDTVITVDLGDYTITATGNFPDLYAAVGTLNPISRTEPWDGTGNRISSLSAKHDASGMIVQEITFEMDLSLTALAFAQSEEEATALLAHALGVGDSTYSAAGSDVGVTIDVRPGGHLSLITDLFGIRADAGAFHFAKLTGSAFADTISGGVHNDHIDGGSGSDLLRGHDGNDTAAGGSGRDSLYGETGNDTLGGGNDDDLVDGGSGNDTQFGEAGNDTLLGASGNDWLVGAAGNDCLSGGTGNDTYGVDSTDDIVSEAGGSGIDQVWSSISYRLADGIENLVLTGSATWGIGNGAANWIKADAGANRLEGGDGEDVLEGGEGDDTLDGGTDRDLMRGGSGNDLYIVDNSRDVVGEYGGGSADRVETALSVYVLPDGVENLLRLGTAAGTVAGNELNNTMTGNAAADLMSGGSGNDSLSGLGSADTLRGEAGSDTLDGGDGDDRLDGGDGADLMSGGTGNDIYIVNDAGDVIVETGSTSGDRVETTLTSYALGEGIEHLLRLGTADGSARGNALANVVTGNTAADLISGGGGNDSLSGLGSADTLRGESGSDTLNGGDGDDRLDGGDGADLMSGGAGNDAYIVDNAGDVIVETGTTSGDRIETTLTSYALGDGIEHLLRLGTANGSATGNALANAITGNAAADLLSGGGGNDSLFGLGGADTLRGEGGSDSLDGGDGDDRLDGGIGADVLRGGTGNDLYIVDDAGDVIVETGSTSGDRIETTLTSYALGDGIEHLLRLGTANGSATGNVLANAITGNAANDVLRGAEGNDSLSGLGGNDSLHAGQHNDSVSGGSGADSLRGEAGNDTLDGGEGDDTVNGGDGADLMRGGSGNDVYIVNNAGDVVLESDGTTGDRVETTLNSYVLADGIEHVVRLSTIRGSIDGNSLNNTMTGAAGADQLRGADGSDSLSGLGGNDTLSGGQHNDTLAGGAAKDSLGGDAGNDLLAGGAGADTLSGGTGNDTFFFGGKLDGNDRIMDFGAAFGANNDYLAFSRTAFAGVDVDGTTPVNGTTFVSGTVDRLKAINLSAAEVLVVQDGTYASSTAALRAINAGTGADAANDGILVVYRTGTDSYTLAYDANGALNGGSTILATLGGVTEATIGSLLARDILFWD